MNFQHRQKNKAFLNQTSEALADISQAKDNYGVSIAAVEVSPGETYWKLIGVYHLLPQENLGNHHVFFEVLDENGVRFNHPIAWAGWTWKGRRPDEPANPIPLDKPTSEPAGDLAMFKGQLVSVWIKGLDRNGDDPSDRVEGLQILHPDERGPEGGLGNSIGHHSFYVVFQRTAKGSATDTAGPVVTSGVISGQVAGGQGYQVRLFQDEVLVAETTVGTDQTFRFENIPFGSYRLEAAAPPLTKENLQLASDNQEIKVKLQAD